jgi:hypothetical protein
MSYGCPRCFTSFPYQSTYGSTHHEAKCPHCDQDLQWDEPTQSAVIIWTLSAARRRRAPIRTGKDQE